MVNLLAAAAFFLAIHLLVAGTRLRNAIVGVIGEGPYMGLFSLASIGGLTWLGFAFAQARRLPSDPVFWSITPATRWLAIALVFVGFLYVVPGLLTRNPTSVKQEGALADPDVARGMLRITRHPFLWGVAIWALAHLIANGDLASLILFGSMLLLALFGTASIDAKRARALGEQWEAFKARTSNLPYAAIVAGRQSLRIGEIWWQLLIGALVFGLVLWGHPYAFGTDPLGR